ncbi:MobQ family relaxase [Vreelandella populi]|uniref:MobQ family relaxase n=1 Tax=Vreelandella populi TaxID=2498858 RepID=UPI000F8EAB93|nr:MobQ family relaxase [Halomonas populi]RUR51946.1 hypothetical protein ELY40_15475 [Halomonas populi]
MSMYHFSGQVISRSDGRSSVEAAAYRSAAKLVDNRTGETHDYRRKKGVTHSEILAPDHAPSWMLDRTRLWDSVEAIEKRKDAQLAREFNVAFPIELTYEQNLALMRDFVQVEFVERGMVADCNMHDLNSHNPHFHVMLSMRTIDGDGWGKKNRDWNQKELLEHWRKAWADTANKHLERAGRSERIDHRSLVDQGITDREPTRHLGPHAVAFEKRTGEKSRRREWIEERAQAAAAAKIQEATIAAEIVVAQREVEVLRLDLEEVRVPVEAKPEQDNIDSALSSDEIRLQLEQARQKLFDPHQKVAMSKAINGAKADLDKIVDKRVAVFERLWALRDDLDNRIPDERKQLQGVINAWRKKNFVRARLHDQGISKSAEIASYQRALSQIDQNKHGVGKRYYQELKVWNDLRDQHIDLEARIEKAISGGLAIMYAKLAPLQAEVDRLENELDQALAREQTRDAATMPDDSPEDLPNDVIDQDLPDDNGDRYQRYQRPRG